jgi:peptidyl-prolyl cis-trans isomerase D
VVDLYGKPVRRFDLARISEQRARANRFIAPLAQTQDFFGGLSTRDLVDAYSLEHEADRLGVPNDPELAKTWLKKLRPGLMNQATFDSLLTMVGRDIDPNLILSDLASQIRLRQAQQLLGSPMITPLDIFQTYRDQNERTSYKVLSFPVANYTDKTREPSDSELGTLFDKYKDVLPDPSSDTPGFKVPRQIKAEILSVDTNALAKQIEAKLTDNDLKTYYENHKAELTPPKELPDDLFANDKEAKLTPPVYRPFDQVRDIILAGLSRERAQEQVTEKFDKIKDDVINKFSDAYHETQTEVEEAKKAGETSQKALPTPTDLAGVAKANGLNHEVTPLLSQADAENYGQIATANAGATPSFDDPKFATVIFDEKNLIYDSLEFADMAGRRYLVRKLVDAAPRVPSFDEARARVVAAWKMEQARDLARKAADEALAKVKADGGSMKEAVVLGRPVFAIDGVTKKRSGMGIPGSLQFNEATEADIPQLPYAGAKLREALFNLKAGEVAVESNAPKDTYYVVTLARRDPVSFSTLYGPSSAPLAYMFETMQTASRGQFERWMKHLRSEAGLPENWTPPGETERTNRKA